jgi:hypothetical protein
MPCFFSKVSTHQIADGARRQLYLAAHQSRQGEEDNEDGCAYAKPNDSHSFSFSFDGNLFAAIGQIHNLF